MPAEPAATSSGEVALLTRRAMCAIGQLSQQRGFMTRNSKAVDAPRARSRRAAQNVRAQRPIPAKESRKGRAVAAEDAEPGIALALLKDFYWIELGIRSYLRSRDNPDFSRAEGMVVANLMLGYSRPSDIARQLGVSRQAIHVTIQQMKSKGIVDLIQDPDDGRVRQVVLTNVAKKMNDDGIVAMGILWQELGRRLGRANLSRAAKVLGSDWGPPMMFDAGEKSEA